MTAFEDVQGLAVITVPRAGRLLEMSTSAAYRAAEAGQIPTLRLGRRLMVPVPRLLAMLGVPTDHADDAAELEAAGGDVR